MNGRAAKANYRLREGDVVEAQPLEIKESAIVPESIPLDVVYEDSDILVINKPRDRGAPGARTQIRHAGERSPCARG